MIEHRIIMSHMKHDATACNSLHAQGCAALPRRCDVMIHSANEYVAKHHRFLLSGTAVGLKALDSGGSTPDPGMSLLFISVAFVFLPCLF